MFEGQNAFKIRRDKGPWYIIHNVHRGIRPDTDQPAYCNKCEVAESCQVLGNPPIDRKFQLTSVLIERCQRALQRSKGMIIPVKDKTFPPSIIANNITIPCLSPGSEDPHPDFREDNNEYWWQNY